MASSNKREELGAYGGKSGLERKTLRREQLLAAGLEVFGTIGYVSASVKAICAQAGLTERYFYETFNDREDLLFAVYERVATEVATAAFQAAESAEPTIDDRARAGMSAFFGLLTGDIRKARVLSFEVVGVSERLEIRRRETMHAFANYLATVALTMYEGESPPRLDPTLTSLSMVGASNELLIEWVLGNLDMPVDELVEHCTQMIVGVTRMAFGEAFLGDESS